MSMISPVTIYLPLLPPSVNSMYTWTGKKQVKSKAYRKWLKDMAWFFNDRMIKRVVPKGSYQAHIYVTCNRNRDIDNIVKPILDLLGDKQITGDDRWCDKVTIERVKAEYTCRIDIQHLVNTCAR